MPFSPSNLVRYIPSSLQSLLKSFIHRFLISPIISNLLICCSLFDVLITKPIYLCRLAVLIIYYTSKNIVFYSDSIRGASRYFTCPLLSAISNSTLTGLSLPSSIDNGSSPLTDFIILLK